MTLQSGLMTVTACLVLLLPTSPMVAQVTGWEVQVEPQPAFTGDNLTMVISGHASCPSVSPAELSTGSASVLIEDACLGPPVPFTARVPLGALPTGSYIAQVVGISEARFTVNPPSNPPPGSCLPDIHTLCLRGGRFRVEASLDDPALVAQWGHPHVRLVSFEAGAMYFFQSSNPELFIKVLDGCGVNGHYWLFVSGLTNLGVQLRVRDIETGIEQVIVNAQGKPFPSRQDISAFACSD